MLDERKMKAIELQLEGKGSTEISKLVGVSRTSIYNWFQEEEIKAELAKREREIKTHAQSRFNARIDAMIDNAEDLALNSSSEKIKADMTQYWIDRTLGKSTTKVEVNTEENKDNVSIDILTDELNEFENE